MRIVAGRVQDFAPGERRIVRVGRRSIGVFRVGDRFYALNNHCPHQGGPLCLGRIVPWAVADAPGQARLVGEERVLVACPWHGWEYELATGRSFLGPGEPPVRRYQVTVEGGQSLEEDAGVRHPERTPGPYVAETFPVRVEDDYVVVDTRPGADGRRGKGGDRDSGDD